jgi:DNA-binding CsgD family transcriptional regulator
MGKIKVEATNKEIAEILGITKGAVDASLCRLKIKWEKMSKNADLN